MTKQIVTHCGKYQEACEDLASHFVDTYYPKDITWHWIHDRVGGTLRVNLSCFEMKEVFDTIRLNPTQDQFFDYQAFKSTFEDDGEECDRSIGVFLKWGKVNMKKVPIFDYDL